MIINTLIRRVLHVSAKSLKFDPLREPKSWMRYNCIVYPPQEENEPPRTAYVHHMRPNIRGSHKKLWYVSQMIRGMTVDEALKQLSFHKQKFAAVMKEVIEEAVEMAVKFHNVEYKSNLWISHSMVTRAGIVKSVRKFRGLRYCPIRHRFSHYFIELQEGKPPKDFKVSLPTFEKRAQDRLQHYKEKQIDGSL